MEPMSDDAYFLPAGTHEDAEVLQPTAHTGSPWTASLQHGGPVAGLLWRACEGAPGAAGWMLTRLAVELLGPVSLEEVAVRADVVRSGRSADLVEAEVLQRGPGGGWRPAARARGWRMRTVDTAAVAYRAGGRHALPPEGSPTLHDAPVPPLWLEGFVGSLDWRFASTFGRRGAPTVAWARLRMPFVAGEEPSPSLRAILPIDAANGVGARLDTRAWTFINTELAIHLFERPTGEWTGIEAESSIGSEGVGLSQAVVHDQHGPVGRIAQSLLVTPLA
ncbi:thioesterase [Agrococcus sp. SGAir0287]|nr:thioesterase [Agrococcus sp. SGAir0287]